jgi:hypothetical protein
MYCRVLNWMSTDVSEVRVASIIRAMRHYRPDDGGSTYLWNAGRHWVKNTAVHPRRFWASWFSMFMCYLGDGGNSPEIESHPSTRTHLQKIRLADRLIWTARVLLLVIIIGSQPYVGPDLPQKLLPTEVSGYCFFRFRYKCLFRGGVVSPTPNPRLYWRADVFCQGCMP